MEDGSAVGNDAPGPGQTHLRPAMPEETLSFALRYKVRKRTDIAGPMVVQIAAEHLRLCLTASS